MPRSTVLTIAIGFALACPDPCRSETDMEPFDDLPEQPSLPDLLVLRDGRPVEDAATWEKQRRPEIIRLFEHYMYGKAPAAPDNLRATSAFTDREGFGGTATIKEVVLNFGPDGAPPIHLLVVSPNSTKPAPVFLGLNFNGNHTVIADPRVHLTEHWVRKEEDNKAADSARGASVKRWPFAEAIARGYAIATFYHGDIDPDRKGIWEDGIQPHYYRDGQTQPGKNEWGTIAAWAWGLSRAGDYLAQDPGIDSERIYLMGHSRNGKTALLAGALDQRFALVVSNQSGCGGAAISRRRMGETVADINKNFPHWFCDEFTPFGGNEDKLPLDQHMLLALIAPRPVLVCSATEDKWADPEGEFAACVGASPVYELLGRDQFGATDYPQENQMITTPIGYHVRPGKHDCLAGDWKFFMDFADLHGGKAE